MADHAIATSPLEPDSGEIPHLWAAIEAQLHRLHPALTQYLCPPATTREASGLEVELRRRLPASFKASLLVHDGETEGAWLGGWYPYVRFLPITDIVTTHTMQQEVGATFRAENEERPDEWRRSILRELITVHGNVKPKLFARDWIPIADSNGDVGLYLDFDPAPGGFAGQVIHVYPEGGLWAVLADSFGELLRRHLSDLEAGSVTLDEGPSLRPARHPWERRGELPPYLR